MKRFFGLIAFVLTVLGINAQTTETTAVFNFMDGSSLNPQLSIPEDKPSISVSSLVFTSGKIKLSFTTPSGGASAQFFSSQESTELRVFRGGTFRFEANSDVEIIKIKFDSQGMDAYELYQSQGTIDYKNDIWNNVNAVGTVIEGIRSVGFITQGAKGSRILKVSVTYREPLNVLKAVSYNPNAASIINSFEKLNVNFNYPVKSVDKTVKLVDKDKKEVCTLSPSIQNGNVVFSAPSAVTTAGAYTVSFDKQTFTSTQGYYNEAFNVYFEVTEKEDTFSPTGSLEFEDSKVPATLEIAFPSPIGHVASTPLDLLNKAGEKQATVTPSVKSGDNKTLVLTLNSTVDITAKDVYTVSVPAKTVYNADYNTPKAKYNPAFSVVVKVQGADAPSAEVLKKAQDLLKNTGVGYPVSDDAARTTLAGMVDAQDQGDDAFAEAITNYVQSANVKMPENGSYYKIANVATDGKTLRYLAYSKGKVTITSDKSKAYSFKAEAFGDGTIGMQTLDEKYLHSLVSSSTYTAATANNVSALGTNSHLTFERIKVADDKAEATLGLLAFKGNIGKKRNMGSDVTAYSNFDGSEIFEGEAEAYFEQTVSGAFKLEPAEAPEPEAVETKATVVVTPTSTEAIEKLEYITVTFPDLTNVTYNNTAYVVDASGKKTSPTSVTPNAAKNEFKFVFPSLANSTYTFVAPEKAFTYSLNGKEVFPQELTKTFTVFYEDVFNENYVKDYTMYMTPDFPVTGAPVDNLNHITIYFHKGQEFVEPFVNPNANDIRIIDKGDKLLTTGKLVKRKNEYDQPYQAFFRNGVNMGEVAVDNGSSVMLVGGKTYNKGYSDEVKTAYRHKVEWYLDLKLNKVLDANNTTSGRCNIWIYAATFGDAKFGEWLANPSVVAKRDCQVNAFQNIPVHVDTTTGIDSVENNDAPTVIFDMTGRRVESMSAPGIYIINGKKYLKK